MTQRKHKVRRLLVGLVLVLASTFTAHAQKAAIKTNVLYDVTTTFNLGAEFGLSPKWTLDVSGNYNPWTFDNNKKWKHWFVQPEARYWFCEKFNGHFFGIHAHGGQYNFGNTDFFGLASDNIKNHRYEGWFVGAGIAYGYAWVLSKHWNIEAEIGVGYAYTKYDKYDFGKCGNKIKDDNYHYFGPTKAALSLVYVF